MRYSVCAINVKHGNGYSKLYAFEAYTEGNYAQNVISITILTLALNNWELILSLEHREQNLLWQLDNSVTRELIS
jgi:hypothetical protein